ALPRCSHAVGEAGASDHRLNCTRAKRACKVYLARSAKHFARKPAAWLCRAAHALSAKQGPSTTVSIARARSAPARSTSREVRSTSRESELAAFDRRQELVDRQGREGLDLG